MTKPIVAFRNFAKASKNEIKHLLHVVNVKQFC